MRYLESELHDVERVVRFRVVSLWWRYGGVGHQRADRCLDWAGLKGVFSADLDERFTMLEGYDTVYSARSERRFAKLAGAAPLIKGFIDAYSYKAAVNGS